MKFRKTEALRASIKYDVQDESRRQGEGPGMTENQKATEDIYRKPVTKNETLGHGDIQSALSRIHIHLMDARGHVGVID
jgi:hypothetical protein